MRIRKPASKLAGTESGSELRALKLRRPGLGVGSACHGNHRRAATYGWLGRRRVAQ